MASARRHEPPCKSSASEQARTTFRNELTACLALTAPVGMTEEARRDWLAVAWDTLKDIPPDILVIGTRKAREKCDHPSKIVPFIVAETADWMRRHNERSRADTETLRLQGPKPNYCTPEEAASILRELGLKRNPLDISPTGGR
jgi:hypothetical protein